MPWLDAHNYLKKKEGKEERKIFVMGMPLKSRAKSVGLPLTCFGFCCSCNQPDQAFESPELPLAPEAEVPTCRGSIPMRNFKSPASSTSNLASHDTTPGSGFALCRQPTR